MQGPCLIPGLGGSAGEGIGYPLQYSWAFLIAQLVKNPPAVQETWVWPLSWEDPMEKGKATHSSILAWRIPWTIESQSWTWLSDFHFHWLSLLLLAFSSQRLIFFSFLFSRCFLKCYFLLLLNLFIYFIKSGMNHSPHGQFLPPRGCDWGVIAPG